MLILLFYRIIGQVAVTGKHQWIFADKHVRDSCLSFEVTSLVFNENK
jgi:hypothetical protein